MHGISLPRPTLDENNTKESEKIRFIDVFTMVFTAERIIADRKMSSKAVMVFVLILVASQVSKI